MTQHTQGEWQVQHNDKVSYVYSKTKIADVYSEAYGDVEQQKANAYLIASAPKLLIALETARAELRGNFCDTEEEFCQIWAVKQIDEAIAAAKGCP